MSSFIQIGNELFEAEHSKVQVDVPGAIYPSHSRKEPRKEVHFIIPNALYDFIWKNFTSQLAEPETSNVLKKSASEYKKQILLIHKYNAAILHGAWIDSVSDGSMKGTLKYDYLEIVERTDEMQKLIDDQRGRFLATEIGIL